MRWKGLFSISEYFMSCNCLELASFLKKQTNKQTTREKT